MNEPIKFLIVDDQEANLLVLEGVLKRKGLELLQARSGAEALEILLTHEVALALLDVQMPDMDGFELAELMRGTERTRRVPIIFVTAGATDDLRRFRGYELGAVDFLFKPIDPHILKSKADVFFELARQRSELKAAVRTAELAQQRFEYAARATTDAIWDWDFVTEEVWWNDGLQQLFGHQPSEVNTAARWKEIVHPEDRERVVQGMQKVIDGKGAFWREEYRLRRADGTYADVFDRGYVIRSTEGEALRMLGAMQDVTERVRAHEILETTVKERTSELRTANAQLETFVFSIAHDLRAPLRAMIGYSQLLVEDRKESLDSEGQRMLERIRGSAEFMDKLLLNLLAFSRVSRAEMTLSRVDVARAWHTAVLQCSEQIEATQARLDVTEPLPAVVGHEATLGQCLANLLSNALKFVPRGAVPHIRFWGEPHGSMVRLYLDDNGVGIPANERERVFRAFERLEGSRFPGSGMGLSIVRTGVERMSGKVGIDTKESAGTRFWVDLPKAA